MLSAQRSATLTETRACNRQRAPGLPVLWIRFLPVSKDVPSRTGAQSLGAPAVGNWCPGGWYPRQYRLCSSGSVESGQMCAGGHVTSYCQGRAQGDPKLSLCKLKKRVI